ncbi:MAG TPA: preprotein translocase subunit SecG [Thermoanaerobaculales bacterium]|nr:preprotein translocase subunit SecG [Thermoanaerobaculales bacterium]HQP44521.1 preprotein translocase subunit SecG [Thermoanaerobaculales bacterium]
MTVLLVIVYVLVCIFLILVVLLQQGKGADLAGAFGGAGSQASFGPRTGTNVMHRLTTVSFVLFVVLSMTLAIMSGKRHGSVMEAVATSPPPATEQAPAGQGTPDLTGPVEGEVIPAPEQAPADAEQPPGS